MSKGQYEVRRIVNNKDKILLKQIAKLNFLNFAQKHQSARIRVTPQISRYLFF